MAAKKEAKESPTTMPPSWFYYVSILASVLFTLYISIYSTLHFESIRYMNVVVVFLFIMLVSFFIISGVYFVTERKGYHILAPVLFFSGMLALILYAYTANDASNIVRYSIIYTIIVMGISMFILLPKTERIKYLKGAKKPADKV